MFMVAVPTLPPEQVACSALTSQSLQVWWEPPPAEGRNGLVQGYKVSYQPAEDWYGKFPSRKSWQMF